MPDITFSREYANKFRTQLVNDNDDRGFVIAMLSLTENELQQKLEEFTKAVLAGEFILEPVTN